MEMICGSHTSRQYVEMICGSHTRRWHGALNCGQAEATAIDSCSMFLLIKVKLRLDHFHFNRSCPLFTLLMSVAVSLMMVGCQLPSVLCVCRCDECGCGVCGVGVVGVVGVGVVGVGVRAREGTAS